MDVALQKHGAKHVYRVPEGLRELCADISREVLRAQPTQIYCFIADYIDALLITRENAKVAVKVVNNIILGSESVVYILQQSGLSLEQIALAASRIQKAFRSYLDIVDVRKAGLQEANNIDEKSRVCIREIIESTGTTWEQAEKAATTIQTAFRSHYKEMLAREARGEVQWQRAVINTIAILRKAGVSQEEAAKAATLIQSSYRGYYIRRNIRVKILTGAAEGDTKKNNEVLDPRETIQAVAWMDMMFQDSGYTREKANEAATIIQAAFRGYRERVRLPSRERPSRAESSQSMVVEAILDNLRQRVWSKLKSTDMFPDNIGSREEMIETVEKMENEFKKKRRKIRISDDFQAYDAQDIEEPVVEAKDSMEAAHSGEDDEEEEEEDDEARSDSNPPDEVDAVMNKAMEPEVEAPAEAEDVTIEPENVESVAIQQLEEKPEATKPEGEAHHAEEENAEDRKDEDSNIDKC